METHTETFTAFLESFNKYDPDLIDVIKTGFISCFESDEHNIFIQNKTYTYDQLPPELRTDVDVQLMSGETGNDYVYEYTLIPWYRIQGKLDEIGILDSDKQMWKSTDHYKKLKADIQQNGEQLPSVGREGVHRLLIMQDLKQPAKYLDMIYKPEII